ncbi:hypothetical protein [uncultured Draconibacterium sp.]|uniref:hypothetical protein n=1 Tax=uncultured Draconibacterium sp. TaxID=1573823 RepID=UPI0029C6416F|nr:hypothetical protein [uncultured Draconibacterium sp.]
MKNELVLNQPEVIELGNEELISTDGGSLLSYLFYNYPVTTTAVLTAIYVDSEVIAGIEKGWTENKK